MTNPISGFDDAFAAPPSRKAADELGQEDFLTLMITQFQNQDPFEPMDNGEFLGQLAQFSTVSGIDTLNSGFSGLEGALRDEQALQAASLVGRNVVADADAAFFDGSSAVEGSIELPAAADSLRLDITDSSGELIRQIRLGPQETAGSVAFSWDGLDDDGEVVDEGTYSLRAQASRGPDFESVPTYIEERVTSVTLGRFGGDMTLNLAGGGSLSLSQVFRISQ